MRLVRWPTRALSSLERRGAALGYGRGCSIVGAHQDMDRLKKQWLQIPELQLVPSELEVSPAKTLWITNVDFVPPLFRPPPGLTPVALETLPVPLRPPPGFEPAELESQLVREGRPSLHCCRRPLQRRPWLRRRRRGRSTRMKCGPRPKKDSRPRLSTALGRSATHAAGSRLRHANAVSRSW